ncbi:CitMHS family transporter [Haladaptatus pallidirubidus]|uniref:Citrate:proton symporter n=2 Tax=Haladaptatus pallidirubidus TaxID=1008152 RepID=A0AAV3UIL4_9EURY|nr:citrate:proton symporter [Haladaptatus pallidirubidus]
MIDVMDAAMPLSGTALGLIGYAVIALVLLLVIWKQLYVIPTLIIAPVSGALIAGFSLEQIGSFTESGLQGIVGIVAMFAFAVWYFSLMREYGLFDPLVKRVIQGVANRPAMLTVGTVIIAMMTHLDGSGATTMLITIPAMIPLYDALNVDRKILAALVGLTAGTMNMVPWGGVVVRGVSAIDPATIANVYNPMIPAHLAGLAMVLGISYRFSLNIRDDVSGFQQSQRRQLVNTALEGREGEIDWMWGINAVLTVLVIGALISGITSPAVAFMLGLVAALVINVREYDQQKEILEKYAADVMTYVGILFAAGVLIGVLQESKMIEEMARILLMIIPDTLGNFLPVVLGVIAMPASLLFSPDAFYFGVLPVVAETGTQFGFSQVAMVRAAIVGQMTVGFPISPLTGATFLLIGLAEVELGEHIRFTFSYMWLTSLVILAVGILTGGIPI